jgi:hypothetical protein
MKNPFPPLTPAVLLRLFRTGMDTNQIAKLYNRPEALVARDLARVREAVRDTKHHSALPAVRKQALESD